MTDKKRPSFSEIDRLRGEMIAADPQPPAAPDKYLAPQQEVPHSAPNQILILEGINKTRQKITDGVPLRAPTEVLEWLDEVLEDRNGRPTALYLMLELGREALERELEKGDVMVNYRKGGLIRR